jgi:predicted heme/steroid binding protein
MKIKSLAIAAMMVVTAIALVGCTTATTPTATAAPAATVAPVVTVAPAATVAPVVTEAPAATEAPAPAVTTAAAPAQLELTVAELAAYNGLNGKPAYVAINGVIYDVTNVPAWKTGTHKGYEAGTDLSDMIGKAPHGDSVLKSLPVVGKLK